VTTPLLLFLSAVGGLFPSFSLPANLYVLALGGTFCWLGLSGRVLKRPTQLRPGRGASWWLAPVLLFAVLELITFAGGSTYDYPTLSALADPVLERYPSRSAVFFLWLVGFWRLLRL